MYTYQIELKLTFDDWLSSNFVYYQPQPKRYNICQTKYLHLDRNSVNMVHGHKEDFVAKGK